MERYERNLTPSSLGNIIPQLMSRYGYHRELGLEKLQNAWNEVLGKNAEKTRLGSKKRGTLEVMVPHNILLQELSFQGTEILAKLRELVPEEKITKLRFVIGNF